MGGTALKHGIDKCTIEEWFANLPYLGVASAKHSIDKFDKHRWQFSHPRYL